VTQWQVWRQDDNGNQYMVESFPDRIGALSRVLVFEAGHPHKQLYWVSGPPGPALGTNRELYLELVRLGDLMRGSGRGLSEFLRAWWWVSRPLAGKAKLDPDSVAAMVCAAATTEPPPLDPAWRTAVYAHPDEPVSHSGWERIVLSQIADLADFAADFADAGPLDEHAYFGVDAPRPPGCQRATPGRWYNFDPKTYLECAMAGTLGGWDDDDGIRTPLPGPHLPLKGGSEPGEQTLAEVSWADLADLAICGQIYE